jgi:hypothetical protein
VQLPSVYICRCDTDRYALQHSRLGLAHALYTWVNTGCSPPPPKYTRILVLLFMPPPQRPPCMRLWAPSTEAAAILCGHGHTHTCVASVKIQHASLAVADAKEHGEIDLCVSDSADLFVTGVTLRTGKAHITGANASVH